jgi:hypothetical protein
MMQWRAKEENGFHGFRLCTLQDIDPAFQLFVQFLVKPLPYLAIYSLQDPRAA